MTTDELINALRKCASPANRSLDAPIDECKGCPFEKPESWLTHMSECIDALQNAAADRLEEQDKIIKQYQKADCFLAAHGWEWEEGGCWYDD